MRPGSVNQRNGVKRRTNRRASARQAAGPGSPRSYTLPQSTGDFNRPFPD
ncbi:MAG: hypothetical protein QGH25_11835 [Candidatus Latescibacteria bacterium]|nr:hypothetical protein [Candidatus Latescibacterota bacterium]